MTDDQAPKKRDSARVSRRSFIAGSGAAAILSRSGLAGASSAKTATGEGAVSSVGAGGHSGPAMFHGSPWVTESSSKAAEGVTAFATSPMGRMFPTLPAHVPTDQAITSLASTMAEPGNNFDNPAIPAGFTFFGQYIDHDITFDEVSSLQGPNDPGSLLSDNSAAMDLDSLYGDGQVANPELYDSADNKKLRLVTTNGVQDLPREPSGIAIIADPRNDQHRIISQIQIAFARFHNRLVDDLRAAGRRETAVFRTAQRQVQFHYQWLIVHDYLPRVAGQDVVDQVLTVVNGTPIVNTQFFNPEFGNAFIPVEFSVAAFRFGHTQIRPAYRLNAGTVAPILGPITDPNNLNGGRLLTSQFRIEWQNFFDIPGNATVPQRGRLVDSFLSPPLFDLPPPVIPAADLIRSLAERNLRRGKAFGLPSGQAVASLIGAPVLTNAQLGLTDPGFNGAAPLWFYILKEGELLQGGQRLGPVGARIVVEVLLGLMAADPNSYLSRQPRFQPRAPIAASRGVFFMGNLLRFVGLA